MPTKICTKCHRLQDLTDFYPDSTKKSGYRSSCKRCNKQQSLAYLDSHRPERHAYNRAYHATHRETELQRMRAYRQANLPERTAYDRAYKAAHADTARQRNAASKARRRDAIAQYNRLYRATHQAYIQAYNRAYHAAYHRAHPEKARQAAAMRRARKRQAPIVVPVSIRHIALRDNWRCHICGGHVTPQTWSLDHLIPLVHGGNHTPDNVALAHRRCNSRRGAGRLPAQLRFFG